MHSGKLSKASNIISGDTSPTDCVSIKCFSSLLCSFSKLSATYRSNTFPASEAIITMLSRIASDEAIASRIPGAHIPRKAITFSFSFKKRSILSLSSVPPRDVLSSILKRIVPGSSIIYPPSIILDEEIKQTSGFSHTPLNLNFPFLTTAESIGTSISSISEAI